MTYDVQITSNVHLENFTVKGWGLLHHAGFLTYPHHDAEGSLTWVRMEVGMKFWVVFQPIDRHNDRKHLQEIAIKLGDFTENEVWIRANCHAEVINIMPGDTLIIPPALYKQPLLMLCIMVLQGKQYCAKGGHKSAVADTETAPLSTEILAAITSHLGVTKCKSASMLLYKGDQFERGELIVREKLDKVLIQFTEL
ncbi:hypothetical protein BDR06DRAFT_966756 [Suillus hirtellus]|nr:hypothetical protein BDR06DRAFT_966756 [Suillus hirtellus]